MSISTQPHETDFISEAGARTISGLFALRVERTPDEIAYRQYVEENKAWRSYSWSEMQHRVCRWRQALAGEGLKSGDRVALSLKNCVEWVCFDQAAQSLSLVVVALYTTDTAENMSYILADAGARLLLVNDEQQWQRLETHCKDISLLKRVWCLQQGENTLSNEENIVRYVQDIVPAEPSQYQNDATDPDALATIIYTSGTTGKPKGVMLSHHNILANAEAVQKRIPAYVDDIFLSFLPLAHGFERTVEYYLPMMAGSQIAYARSIEKLIDDLSIIRPTVFISAPRLYEKIYAAIQTKIANHWLKQKLFKSAVSLGWQYFKAGQRQCPPLNLYQRMLYSILYKLVAEKVLSRLGGRLRIAVTGAAPLSVKVAQFFLGLGVPLFEGYGLTEAGPVVSCNRPDKNVPGSVGEPLPGVEVMTAENGELLVRSSSVMQGYWRQEEKTGQAIDGDGWLHTGDLAEIKAGQIYIRGRLKEILVTSTGEKVAPADMETAITLDPLFEQAMVVGEGKPFISALLVLNVENWSKYADELGLEASDSASLHSQKAKDAVIAKLAGLLGEFPGYAQIRTVYLTCEQWAIDNGLLTPTMKIKRKALEGYFAEEIKELYKGHVLIE